MKTYNIQLTIEQWQIVGEALGEMAFKKSAPILAELNKQLTEQSKPTAVETLSAAE